MFSNLRCETQRPEKNGGVADRFSSKGEAHTHTHILIAYANMQTHRRAYHHQHVDVLCDECVVYTLLSAGDYCREVCVSLGR